MKTYRTEYPRPSFRRSENSFVCLNGEWDFRIGAGKSYPMKINVPFVLESKLSGIGITDFMTRVSYRRFFDAVIPESGRVLLRFGAVDYLAEVFVNNISVGSHKGGYTPFSFDITSFLRQGSNELRVEVFDDTRDSLQPSGKQCQEEKNHGCFYTRSTGIWQTVWLEYLPDVFLENVKLTPDTENGMLHLSATLNKYASGLRLSAEVSLYGETVSASSAVFSGKALFLSIPVPNAKLWDVDSPVLYDLKLSAGEDEVNTYFGMRKIEICGQKVLLNGRCLFQRLVLDQGYYPDGIYTAPEVDDMEKDIILAKKVGFNGARLHMKVFEPYTAYYADKHGYLLWGEYPNWGLDDSNPAALDSMLCEWIEELERDYNHPSVIGWCPFNETGIARNESVFRAVRAVTKAYDPFRLYIDTSGYVHVTGLSDIYDIHNYESDAIKLENQLSGLNNGSAWRNFPDNDAEYEGQPYFVSEYGGIHWDIDTDGSTGWGYGENPKSPDEYLSRIKGTTRAILKNDLICGFCFTQLTDVMQEKNGIYSFDRRSKLDSEKLNNVFGGRAAIEE